MVARGGTLHMDVQTVEIALTAFTDPFSSRLKKLAGAQSCADLDAVAGNVAKPVRTATTTSSARSVINERSPVTCLSAFFTTKQGIMTMAKFKPKRTGHKTRPKTGSRKSRAQTPHPNSKQQKILDLLRRSEGVTIAALTKVTGWQEHSVHGFFAGVVRRSSGSALSPRTLTARELIGSSPPNRLSQRAKQWQLKVRYRRGGSAIYRCHYDRDRGQPNSLPRHRDAPPPLAYDLRRDPTQGADQGYAGTNDRLPDPGGCFWWPRWGDQQTPGPVGSGAKAKRTKSAAQARHCPCSRVRGGAAHRDGRSGWLPLAGQDLFEPFLYRAADHRHEMERSPVLRPSRRRRYGGRANPCQDRSP